MRELEINLNKAKSQQSKRVNELTDLKAEVINAIRGTSKWSAELLNEIIIQTETSVKNDTALVEQYQNDLTDSQRLITEVKSQYDNLLN